MAKRRAKHSNSPSQPVKLQPVRSGVDALKSLLGEQTAPPPPTTKQEPEPLRPKDQIALELAEATRVYNEGMAARRAKLPKKTSFKDYIAKMHPENW